MQPLIHESHHADENSARHEVEMLTALLGKKPHDNGLPKYKCVLITYLVHY